jgi:hypothetical protein
MAKQVACKGLFVCRKNMTHAVHKESGCQLAGTAWQCIALLCSWTVPEVDLSLKNRCPRQLNRAKSQLAVEKRLHIHRIGCAEGPLFGGRRFLSTNGAACIQRFSSTSEVP